MRNLILFTLAVVTSGPGARPMDGQIVYRDSAGRQLTLDEVRTSTGQINWELVGAENVPEEASRLHQAGRQAGARGESARALELLAEAASLAPDWPYPLYDAAFTHLLNGDFTEALTYYRRTVELSPRGFFTALTAVQTLERELAGDLPEGIYLAYIQLEWMQSVEEKEARVQALLSAAPSFAPAWKELALLSATESEQLEAIATGLSANPDPETRGILLINRAITLFNRGEQEEALMILGDLALDPRSSLGAVEQAKAVIGLLLQDGRAR